MLESSVKAHKAQSQAQVHHHHCRVQRPGQTRAVAKRRISSDRTAGATCAAGWLVL